MTQCRVDRFVEEVSSELGERAVKVLEGRVSGVYGFSETPPPMDSWPLCLLGLRRGIQLPPIPVARPISVEGVEAVVEAAARHGVRLLVRGGGSAVTGSLLPCRCCAVLAMDGLRRVEVDEDNYTVVAEAGATIAEVESLLNRRGLTLRFHPQSMELATIGGAIATRGAGAYQPGIGNIEDAVLWIDVVTSARGLLRFGEPRSPRGSLAVDGKRVFIGSEGALGAIVRAGLRALPLPEYAATVSAAMPSFEEGLETARSLVYWARPELLRVLDEPETSMVFGLEGSALIARVEGDDRGVVEARARAVEERIRSRGGKPAGEDLYERWARHRAEYRRQWESLVAAGLWADTADVAAPWSTALTLRRRVQDALEGVEGFVAATVHAGHFYPTGASLYFTLVFEPSPAAYWRVWRRLAEAVEASGATLTHHHGLGALRLALGAWSPDLDILCATKRLLDPHGVFWSTLARACAVKTRGL